MKGQLLTLLESIRAPNVLVIGDMMLDVYVWGHVDRISPEAPIQVLKVESEEPRPGGAGNVANNLVALGAHVSCCAVVGDDHNGRSLCRMLEKMGIDPSGVLRDKARPTTVKTRMIAHGQQLLRVDREDDCPLDKGLGEKMIQHIEDRLPWCDVALLSDYAKGTIPDRLLTEILARCKKGKKPVLIDPSRHRNYRLYNGCTVLKPNRAEAESAAGVKIENEKSLKAAAAKIMNTSKPSYLVITRGSEGMTIFDGSNAPQHIAGLSRTVFDITGAGDTVLSLLGFVLAGGGTMREAAEIANVAAGISVGKVGAVPVSKTEIIGDLLSVQHMASHKLKSFDEIESVCKEHRRQKEKIVFANGCFDLLHVGHIKLFQFAKNMGEVLVVGLNSDESVRKLKGPGRPVLGQNERSFLLSALEHVDYVVVFEERTPLKLIRKIRPDVLVKGADYTKDTVVGREFVESYGGRVELAPLVDGVSSSDIMSRIAGHGKDTRKQVIGEKYE